MSIRLHEERQSVSAPGEVCLTDGGAEGIRTPDPHNAIVVLYQLSYDPIRSRFAKLKVTGDFVKKIYRFWSKAENRPSRLLMGADRGGFKTVCR